MRIAFLAASAAMLFSTSAVHAADLAATAAALRDRALTDTTAWDVTESLTTEVGARAPDRDSCQAARAADCTLVAGWMHRPVERNAKRPSPTPWTWRRLVGEGQVVQLGKTIGLVDACLKNEHGTRLAKASASVRPIPAGRIF